MKGLLWPVCLSLAIPSLLFAQPAVAPHGDSFAAVHLCFLRDGKTIMASSPQSSRLLDSKTGKLIRTYATLGPGSHKTYIECVAVSTDGKLLATGSNGDAILWEVGSGKLRWRRTMTTDKGIHESYGVAFSPDSRFVVLTAADNNTVATVWTTADGKEASKLAAFDSSYPRSAAFTKCGDEVVFGMAGGDIIYWRIADGSLRAALRAHTGDICALAVDPSSNHIYSACEKDNVRIWDVPTVRTIRELKMSVGGPASVSCSRDGKLAASSDALGVSIWDCGAGKEKRYIKSSTFKGRTGEDYVYDVAFSPDTRELAAGCDNGEIAIVSTEDGKVLRTLDARNPK